MISFFVINWDFTRDIIEHYDVMPYLYRCFKEEKRKQKMKNADVTLGWLKELIDRKSKYMYWSRCEYECIVHGWPVRKNNHKMDVYEQIKMNLDNIAKLMFDDIKKNSKG